MNEFIKGAYNPHEHDYTERTDEQLQDRMNLLHENNRLVGYSGERLRQVTNEMTHIAFEMAERLRESREQDIEQAWSEYGKVDA